MPTASKFCWLTTFSGVLAFSLLAACDADETTQANAAGASGSEDGQGGGGAEGDGGSGGRGPVCGNGEEEAGEECDDGDTRDDDDCLGNCTRSTCGDGEVNTAGEKDEECDDGNTVATDSCTNDCRAARCGDGIVGPKEACDDGDEDDSDGCTVACKVARCGDGHRQDTEECDDGNSNDRDNCLNACLVAECGDGVTQADVEKCDDGNSTDTDTCTSKCEPKRCGDGHVGPGEACDDGNQVDTDQCKNDCSSPTCGDGVTSGSEECDDGDQDNSDNCLTTCVRSRCGDGFLEALVEACDDGNQDATDSCLNTCVAAKCGDSTTWNGVEGCDDGNTDPLDGCDQCRSRNCGNGAPEDGEECDDGNAVGNDACTNTCFLPKCGDRIIQTAASTGGAIPPEESEECDDGNPTNEDECLRTCRLNQCGDGYAGGKHAPGDCSDGQLERISKMRWATKEQGRANEQTSRLTGNSGRVAPQARPEFPRSGFLRWALGAGASTAFQLDGGAKWRRGATCADVPEECDDGNSRDTDACLNSCRAARCGDEVIRSGVEDCDLGDEDTALPNNDNFGNDCTRSCKAPTCGDGYRNQEPCAFGRGGLALPGANCEECDDGNASEADSCLNDCIRADCGDGRTWGGVEACDDGNANDRDACTNNCALDTCGDGAVDPGEECDNIANDEDNDYADCTDRCMKGKCGDGYPADTCRGQGCEQVNVQFDVEDCDDGNQLDNDDCVSGCKYAKCGDGRVNDSGACTNCPAGSCPNKCEECDDGNSDNNDACTSDCEVAECGDGIVQAEQEECDDGDINHDDADSVWRPTLPLAPCDEDDDCDGVPLATGCSCDNRDANGPGCKDEGSDPVQGYCGFATTGDGQADGDQDACTNGCKQAECGDGITARGTFVRRNPPLPNHEPLADVPYAEACDDGNADDLDFCSNSCKPSTCADGILHYGVVNPEDPLEDQVMVFEQCDDNNSSSADRCPSTCVHAYCGDGFRRTADCEAGLSGLEAELCEACDDGDQVPANACTNTCDLPVCGDGIVQAGEECDAGGQSDWLFCHSPGDSQECKRECNKGGFPDALIYSAVGDSCFFVMGTAFGDVGTPEAPPPGNANCADCATYKEAAWSCYQINFREQNVSAPPKPLHPPSVPSRTHLATPVTPQENSAIVGMLHSLDAEDDAWIGRIPLADPQWALGEPNPTGGPGAEDINCVGIAPADGKVFAGTDDDPNLDDRRYTCATELAGDGCDRGECLAPAPGGLPEDRRLYVCEHEWCTGDDCGDAHPRGCWVDGNSDAQGVGQNVCDATVPLPMEDDTGFLPWCFCDEFCDERNDCCRNRTAFRSTHCGG